MDDFFATIFNTPIVIFTVLLLVALVLPPIFERLRLPGLIGLLAAGVVMGPSGLGLLSPETETMELLSDIGKVYLMFVVGLEIDLVNFRKTKNRSLGFGFATFLIPLMTGICLGRLFDFGWNSAILMGSLLASHTLLGYPIVNRLGITANEAVTVAIGATIFTDIAALLVLAICVTIQAGEFSLLSLGMQLMALAVYASFVLVGIRKLGRAYFRRTGDEQSNQFLFVLLALFLASIGAQAIRIDRIVGAFLAGLAINDVVGDGPVKEKIEFVGSTLFIPFFFIGMGLLLNVPTFAETLSRTPALPLAMVAGLIGSKFLAAIVVKGPYRYTWAESMTMWSLSLPQVAATLAAALVGFQAGLLTEPGFNSVIVLMLVTSILGPVLTSQYGKRLAATHFFTDKALSQVTAQRCLPEAAISKKKNFTIITPISNPDTETHLIEVAAMLASCESGKVIPLVITPAHVQMDDPLLDNGLAQGRARLLKALTITQTFGAEAEAVLRIDDDIAKGIARTAKERDADLVVMGWNETTRFPTRLLGSIIDDVIWSAHCPVAVMRLLKKPTQMRSVLVPIGHASLQSLRKVQFAQQLTESNHAEVTVLYVCAPDTSVGHIIQIKTELRAKLSGIHRPIVKIVRSNDIVQRILRKALSTDLIILSFTRRRTASGLMASDLTHQLLRELTCSIILFNDPFPAQRQNSSGTDGSNSFHVT